MRSYNPGALTQAQSYGLGGSLPTQVGSELHGIGGAGLEDEQAANWWHPDSPLFWVGALIAATFGLAAISTSGSVRVGPVHASASAGAGN